MNTITRVLVQDTGYAHGFERIIKTETGLVSLGSSRHPVTVEITESGNEGAFYLLFSQNLPLGELRRGLSKDFFLNNRIEAWDTKTLAVILKRAAELGIALPDTPERKYQEKIAAFLAEHSDARGTETERLARRRIGQDIYREALVEYWGGTCAITAIDVPELLRASHAKPWANCELDSERLNVYNGFLLSANLDALFDVGLITFNNRGSMVFSSRISDTQNAALGLSALSCLRWIDERHWPFLEWHRDHVFKN